MSRQFLGKMFECCTAGAVARRVDKKSYCYISIIFNEISTISRWTLIKMLGPYNLNSFTFSVFNIWFYSLTVWI